MKIFVPTPSGFIAVTTMLVTLISKEEHRTSEIAMLNIEALTQAEGVTDGDYVSFSFNGQYWHGTTTSGNYGYFPKYESCHINGYDGHQVYCATGKGNCMNGTSCIHD